LGVFWSIASNFADALGNARQTARRGTVISFAAGLMQVLTAITVVLVAAVADRNGQTIYDGAMEIQCVASNRWRAS
jgi:ABC-type nickel/cobalt efflux system permease component RcnA